MMTRTNAEQLRQELQTGVTQGLRLRRAMIVLSLVGMVSMAIVSLFQTGVIRHLPDPPLRRFDSDGVNSSDLAYQWGVPDGTVSLASHAVNAAIAATGGSRRAGHNHGCRCVPPEKQGLKR